MSASRTASLGPQHPDTLASRYNLARTLGELGRWQEAVSEHESVLAVRDQLLGPEHPDTLGKPQQPRPCDGPAERFS
ncbi:tetratricopeptide repeat protein [Streptomyces sp. NPDC050844]|uniref:tetratricopeptide repeat protein n=1 Tax=Streptomyces sp. NPDC050844 TaxID=3155790 RepID=UPI00340EEF3E